MTHLQASIPFRYAPGIPFTGDILESVATFPLATVPSAIAFHGVAFCEVVPRSDKLYGFD